MVQISLDHVDLIEIRQQRTNVLHCGYPTKGPIGALIPS
jgi:hypothetical protein